MRTISVASLQKQIDELKAAKLGNSIFLALRNGMRYRITHKRMDRAFQTGNKQDCDAMLMAAVTDTTPLACQLFQQLYPNGWKPDADYDRLAESHPIPPKVVDESEHQIQ